MNNISLPDISIRDELKENKKNNKTDQVNPFWDSVSTDGDGDDLEKQPQRQEVDQSGLSTNNINFVKPLWEKGISNLESDDEVVMKKKRFLMRLTNALHAAGNLSFRTERYVEQVAQVFGIQALLKVYPVTATLSFYGVNVLASESYNFRISPGLSAFKLGALDQLCYDIHTLYPSINFEEADSRLLTIETTKPKHPWWMNALCNGTAAFTVTVLLFHGNWIDGVCAFFLGLLNWFIGVVCKRFNGMPELQCFLTSFVITSVVAILHSTVLDENQNCVFGQVFGSLAWLFPGLTITIACIEIYSSMIVYGSARLMYGIFVAMQLGFGMSMGYRIVAGKQSSDFIQDACVHPVHDAYAFILLPALATSFALLVDASWSQVPGTIFTCLFGFLYNNYLGPMIPPDVSPFLSAIVVTFAARIYSSRIHYERPLVYIIVGLFMLVPGGLGVKGMSSMWSGDVWSGMAFTFQMLMVGVSLAIGVFVALLPRTACLVRQSDYREITYSQSLAMHLADGNGNLPPDLPTNMLEPDAVVLNNPDNNIVLLNPI